MSEDLGKFEGKLVSKTTIAVRNAGDGLSAAMKVDPQLLHQGDTVYVVLECEVGPVSFDPIKDSSAECVRKHVLKAGTAALIDKAAVHDALEVQRLRIAEADEKEKGTQKLTDVEGTDIAALHDEHLKGQHAEPVPGCPDCPPSSAENPIGEHKPPKKAPAKRRAPAKKRGGGRLSSVK